MKKISEMSILEKADFIRNRQLELKRNIKTRLKENCLIWLVES